jgi:hypothetical protein
MANPKQKRARLIMKEIHDILWNDWDPIGVNGHGPDDEYDSYIGDVYRILTKTPDASRLIEHLYREETETMGLPPRDPKCIEPVAKKLLAIDLFQPPHGER